MLADNIMFLRQNYPLIYQELRKDENESKENSVVIEKAKNNDQTLKATKNGIGLYLHSKYNPIREAETIIDQLEEREKLDENSHVIFYGLGLGYHIDAFIKRHPNITFSLYEPSEEVFKVFLNYKNIKEFKLKNIFTIQCETKKERLDEFFIKLLNNNDKKIIIAELPSYKNIFEEEYTRFFKRFIEIVREKRSTMGTNLAFQQRWILNSAINLKEVLKTPNILMQNNGVFKGKTVLLISAGPSLDEEIENLRMIKEKGLAYIFTVGSAVNTLLHHHILPDAMCTYDPTEKNQMVFQKINTENITNIPMIFGSSVGYETLQQYRGPKYHMLTSQDSIAHYFFKDKNIKLVNDASTIAVVTLQLLKELEFSTIILVGQNLGYKGNKSYAGGIDYAPETVDLQNSENLIKIPDVYGNEIFTIDVYNSMRTQMEFYIKKFDISVINSTKGGAHIEGTQFIPMETLLDERLSTKIVDENIFKKIDRLKKIYNKSNLEKKLKNIKKAHSRYQSLLLEVNQLLLKIKELLNNFNLTQAAAMYGKVDVFLNEIESNDFFITIVKPIHRTQYEVLANKIQGFFAEKNELKKIKKLLPNVETLISLLYADRQLNQQIIDMISDYVNQYDDHQVIEVISYI